MLKTTVCNEVLMKTIENKICKFCSKEQPELNLFCIKCNKREWTSN